jgi:hypothetical protein
MIDFTKPLRCKITKLKVNIIYSDEIGCLIRYNKNTHFFRDSEIEEHYENIPEEPRKFKAYIGLKKLPGRDRIESSMIKKMLEDNGFEQIQEVEFISGEGLQ